MPWMPSSPNIMRGRCHPAWNVILTIALPLIMPVYAGVAEAAVAIAHDHAKRRRADPMMAYLLCELTNHLTKVQLAVDDMFRLANDLGFASSLDLANAILV